jgi:hypothetical protein
MIDSLVIFPPCEQIIGKEELSFNEKEPGGEK